jgi:AP-1 complex subunit beta-1
MEKLDVLVMLISERTVDQVLAEFKEYASEIDWYPVYWLYWSKSTNTDAAHCCSEFVCKAVRCIGRTAIKLAQATERCVNVLVSLIETKVNYLVQEASIVIRDILRKSLRIRP